MLSEIVASPEGIVDVDTYMIHGESPEVIVDGLTDSIVNAAVEDPYLREQAWPAFSQAAGMAARERQHLAAAFPGMVFHSSLRRAVLA